MGNSVMCDCVVCRARKPKGPPAKDNGTTGEHLCQNCLNRRSCVDANKRFVEDMPDLEAIES